MVFWKWLSIRAVSELDSTKEAIPEKSFGVP